MELAPAVDAAVLTVTGQADALKSAAMTADSGSIAQLRRALVSVAVVAQGGAISQLALFIAGLAPGMTATQIQALVPDAAGDLFDAALVLIPRAALDTVAHPARDELDGAKPHPR